MTSRSFVCVLLISKRSSRPKSMPIAQRTGISCCSCGSFSRRSGVWRQSRSATTPLVVVAWSIVPPPRRIGRSRAPRRHRATPRPSGLAATRRERRGCPALPATGEASSGRCGRFRRVRLRLLGVGLRLVVRGLLAARTRRHREAQALGVEALAGKLVDRLEEVDRPPQALLELGRSGRRPGIIEPTLPLLDLMSRPSP